MDKKEIRLVLEAIGASNVQEGSRNIQCSCFLAPWRKGHRAGTDSRPSMGVSIQPNGESKVHCFACEYGGTLKRSLQDLAHFSGEDFDQLIQKVGKYEDIDPSILVETIPPYEEHSSEKPELYLGESILKGIVGYAHTYLFDRGFELDTLKEWESGYDRKSKRVVFPIRNENQVLVGAVGRTLVGDGNKYYNYFGFDKSRYLFGEHKVKPGTSLVVVEGLLDVVKVWQGLHQQGLLDEYSVVGLLGTEPSTQQCRKLLSYSDEIVLFLDNDQAGWLGQNKLALAMQKQVLLRAVDYPPGVGTDPDDVVASEYPLKGLFGASKLLIAKSRIDWR